MELKQAIIQVESNGNDFAIGDKHLVDMAYGAMQIRKPVCIDVNNRFGYTAKAQDMLGNRALSERYFDCYMSIYAQPSRLGRPVTDEDRARIWNGGPNGHKRSSTVPYWNKVKKLINKK
jgi:hypothetical protein